MEENTQVQETTTDAVFVGPRKVHHLELIDVKSYRGTEVFRVFYEGGFNQVMTQTTFNAVKNAEPKDFNHVRSEKFKHVLKELYPLIAEHFNTFSKEQTNEERSEFRKGLLGRMTEVIAEYDVTVAEIQSLLQLMTGEANALFGALGFQMDASFGRANNFLWTNDDSNFIPGHDGMNDITLVMAKQVIGQIPVKEEIKEEVTGNDEGGKASE